MRWILVAAAVVACQAMAADQESFSCETLGAFAQMMMVARQGGTPMANCLRAAEGFREDMVPKALHKSFKPLAESIVIEAYPAPNITHPKSRWRNLSSSVTA